MQIEAKTEKTQKSNMIDAYSENVVGYVQNSCCRPVINNANGSLYDDTLGTLYTTVRQSGLNVTLRTKSGLF